MERGKHAVENILIDRHAALQGAASDNARTQHDVINIESHHAGHSCNQQRRVLIIGVQHDHDVSAFSQGFPIAGLLVASVAVVLVVNVELQSQLVGDLYRPVGTVSLPTSSPRCKRAELQRSVSH